MSNCARAQSNGKCVFHTEAEHVLIQLKQWSPRLFLQRMKQKMGSPHARARGHDIFSRECRGPSYGSNCTFNEIESSKQRKIRRSTRSVSNALPYSFFRRMIACSRACRPNGGITLNIACKRNRLCFRIGKRRKADDAPAFRLQNSIRK